MDTSNDAQPFLSAVDARLDALLAPREAPIALDEVLDVVRGVCLAPRAKRVRPRLVRHFGMSVGLDPMKLVSVAIAAELCHTASLMHDDVIDDGHERRGVATVNHKVGNAAAVLGGDLLLTSGLRELASEPPGVTQLALAVVDAMTWSAIAEVRARGRSDLSLDAWRSIAEGKTGALFSWCGEAPAFLANDDDAFARFSRCGRHFGVAFQLADDVLDLLGDSGKDRFADVKNKNPSYPLLFAREAAPQVFSRIEELWAGPEISSDDVASLGNELLAAGIAQATLEALQAEVAAGIDALGRYAEKPGGADIARWATDLASVHGKANGSA